MNRILLSNPRLARSFGNLATDVEHMMDRLFGEAQDGQGASAFMPSLDVVETDTGFDVSVDLPGVKPEDVNVEFKDDQLTISGSRAKSSEEGNRRYHRVERMIGSFSRTIGLPSSIDHDKIQANYSNGVLHIALPKAAAAQPRRIQIQSGTAPSAPPAEAVKNQPNVGASPSGQTQGQHRQG